MSHPPDGASQSAPSCGGDAGIVTEDPLPMSTVTVNGRPVDVRTEDDTALLYVLRNHLGLKGTRFGCGMGVCGACLVLVDGNPVYSCDTPVWSVTGKAVTTVEGLGTDDGQHPVARAIVEEQAAQCGYCMSGIVVSAAGLLATNPDPSESEVRTALDDNLCRCGAHNRVVRAVLEGRRRDAHGRLVTVGALPPSLAANPRLGDWLRIVGDGIDGADGIVEIRSGKVELGQGVLTALGQIAAEELDVDVDRIRMTAAATHLSPDEGYTAGSLSIQHSGAALRQVCAEVRGICTSRSPPTNSPCRRKPSRSRTAGYAAPTARPPATGNWRTTPCWTGPPAVTRHRKPYRATTSSAPTSHGSTCPTSSPAGPVTSTTWRWTAWHTAAWCDRRRAVRRCATSTPHRRSPCRGSITVVRDGDFLAVVAEREEVALRAADRLRHDADWEEHPTLPDEDGLPAFLTSAPTDTTVIADVGSPPHAGIVRSHSASYHRPYLAHGSIGPSCAIAVARGAHLEIWTHSQGVHVLRREIARSLGMAPDQLVVRHVEGPGCYGHNGADDAAMDAAVLAIAVPGRPVQVVWSRPDELSWSPLGPAGVARVSADPRGERRHIVVAPRDLERQLHQPSRHDADHSLPRHQPPCRR